MPRFVSKTAVIAAGQSLSAVIDCSTGAPVFLHMPADWTSARISYQVSPDGTTYNDLFGSDAREIQHNVVAGTSILIDSTWEPVTYLKLRSGGRDNPVPQEADRTITITIDTSAAGP
jgi:hypothetical protein